MTVARRRTIDFLAYFARAYPAESLRLVVLLAAAGAVEAVGLLTLVPALGLLVDPAGEASGVRRMIAGALSDVGLDPTLPLLLSILVGALAAKGALRWMAMRQVGSTVARIGADLRLRLAHALLYARWPHFPEQVTGRLANDLGAEAFRAALAYRQACLSLAAAVQVAVYAALAIFVSWRVALLAVGVAGVLAVVLGGLVRANRRAGEERADASGALVGRFTDVLQQVKAVKSLGVERYFDALLHRDARRVQRAEERQVLLIEALHALQEPLLAALLALGLYAAVSSGRYPLPELLLLVFLFHRISHRMHVVQAEFQAMAGAEGSFWSLHASASAAEEAREEERGGVPPPPIRAGIRFDGVTFSHDTTLVLEGASFDIPAGRMTAIVGPSGAGKTTIADLLLGLLEPEEGEILVDGVPLSTIDPDQWRRQVGYVPQEPLLLNDTVAANVALGRAIDPPAIEAALRAAGAWAFVSALPGGLDAPVGERGLRLSGGQRARIALARALAGSPSILLLDEATASLDPEAEQEILTLLASLCGERTVILVSHRPHPAARADRVLRVAGGQVRSAAAAGSA